MPPVGFEPTISAGKRPQTYALERAATGTGHFNLYKKNIFLIASLHLVSNMGSLSRWYALTVFLPMYVGLKMV